VNQLSGTSGNPTFVPDGRSVQQPSNEWPSRPLAGFLAPEITSGFWHNRLGASPTPLSIVIGVPSCFSRKGENTGSFAHLVDLPGVALAFAAGAQSKLSRPVSPSDGRLVQLGWADPRAVFDVRRARRALHLRRGEADLPRCGRLLPHNATGERPGSPPGL